MHMSLRRCFAVAAAVAALVVAPLAPAATPDAAIGVVVMHGKGGQPGKFVDRLAAKLESAGFQVANLDMPWSGRRNYDVDRAGAEAEVTRALDAMRAKGARKLFVAGHSQGGLFAVHYGGRQAVDGVVAIAPGGQVDAQAFVKALGGDVARARQMAAEGRGGESAAFSDYEGSRGTSIVRTTAAIYLDWFDPETGLSSRAFGQLRPGTPALYVAPTRDYPGLVRVKQQNFAALPPHPLSRMSEPDSDHLGAPAASADEVVGWIRQVAAQ